MVKLQLKASLSHLSGIAAKSEIAQRHLNVVTFRNKASFEGNKKVLAVAITTKICFRPIIIRLSLKHNAILNMTYENVWKLLSERY
jgi:hypothetical protein